MTLYAGPEEHAANPPESWSVTKDGRLWILQDQNGRAFESQKTKRAAEQSKIDGWHARQWEKERRWYGGETEPGRRSWAQCKADHERQEQARRRVIEKMGTTPERFGEWRQIVRDRDAIATRPGAVEDAAADMFDLLNDASLINPSSLNREEAAELYRDLAESWGFASLVSEELHRVKYLGIGAERSAIEVLESLEREELEAAR